MQAESFGAYLRHLRRERGLTIRNLQEMSGVSNGYLSQLETGKRGIPSPDILQRLFAPLGISYEELMAQAGYLITTTAETDTVSSLKPVVEKEQELRLIPVYHLNQAVKLKYVEPTEFVGRPLDSQPIAEYLYFIVDDASMERDAIPNGSRVLVRRQSFIEDGNIAVVIYQANALIRKIYYQQGQAILQASHAEYPPILTEISQVQPIGKVVGVERSLF